MKQYCRYCTYASYGDVVYCACQERTMSDEAAKRVNKCKDFEFNEMDLFNPERKYMPRKAKPPIQEERLF